MSERHFLRRFTAETGMTPARYVARGACRGGPPRARDRHDDPVAVIAAPRRVRHVRVDAPHVPPPRRRVPGRLPPPLQTTPIDNERGPSWTRPTHIAIPLFPRFTALDGIGPYEVLQRIPGFDVTFIGHERGVVRSENGFLGIEVDADVRRAAGARRVVFPGGVGRAPLMHDERVLDWVRTAHETTTFTTSVCTGSLVLAAAGLLDGLHGDHALGARDVLPKHGAVISEDRVVEHLDRRIITAAGVSSGIDMALRLVELLVDRTAAEAAQLMIEYDPQPPFDAGALPRPTTS